MKNSRWLLITILLLCGVPAAFGQEASPPLASGDANGPAVAAPAVPEAAAPASTSPPLAAPAAAKPSSSTEPIWWGAIQKELNTPKEPRAGNGAAEAAATAADSAKVVTPLGSAAPETKPDQTARPAIIYIKGLSALCVVLALILILAYVLKRYGKKNVLFAAPSLGQPMGRVYLAPRVSVHFMRTGGKVLLIGVTQNSIARLAEFDAETFDHESFSNVPQKESAPDRNPADFLTQLKSHINEIESGEEPANGNALKTKPTAGANDDADVASLRSDIERLQKYLKENSSGEGN